jgi:hypothetical protein
MIGGRSVRTKRFSGVLACAIVWPLGETRDGTVAWSARQLTLAALVVVCCAATTGRDAGAYTAAGDRVFPSTLVLPQFAPGDELYIWGETQPQTPDGPGSPWHDANATVGFDKTITDRLGAVIEETWTEMETVKTGPKWGMQNLDSEIKYEAIDDQPHEFLMTLGLDREFGGTGAARVGAFAAGATTPRLYLEKGLGDLDIGLLRPLAFGALIGYQIADAAPRPNLYTPGFFVEYSIPYLESKVATLPLPEFVRHLTPIAEVRFTVPSGESFGARATALIAPGVSYAGPGWEVGAEALFSGTNATGRGVGVIAQLHLALDYLFPDTIGRPIFAAP